MGICVSCRRGDRKVPEKRVPSGGGGLLPAKGAAAELLPRRAASEMANSISNIKMTNPIKGIVSKRRKRYIKDGFNLDLAYITDRLIAMGFPAEKLEGVYRNHIDEVYRFLEYRHKDHYKIYNLCTERSYEKNKFHDRVAKYPFDDHTPPHMGLIQPFCEDVHSWLAEDPRNVAAVHCKAGKGRTGTMVCCYLLYSGQKTTADEALKFYGTRRTHDEKGVTIPSQRRYVEYYASLVRSRQPYSAAKLHIRELVMSPTPALNGGQCTLELTVTQAEPPLKAPSGCHEVRKHDSQTRVVLTQCTPLVGDVRVDVYTKPKMKMRKEKLFHFWFNTFFVANCVGAVKIPPPPDSGVNLETFKLTLNKWQLDDAHKDKQHKIYSADFKVELIVQKQPDSSRFTARADRAPSPPSASSASSEDDPDTEPDAHWDSEHNIEKDITDDQRQLINECTLQCHDDACFDPTLQCDPTSDNSPPLNYYEQRYISRDCIQRDNSNVFSVVKCRVHNSDSMDVKFTDYKMCEPEFTDGDAYNDVNKCSFDCGTNSTTSDASCQWKGCPNRNAVDTFSTAETGTISDVCMSRNDTEEFNMDNGKKDDVMDCLECAADEFKPADELEELNPENGKRMKDSKKKQSYFKRDETKDVGKIPKVASDHTISDGGKKKGLFHRSSDEGAQKGILSLGDVRASWREFSGKWTENRKKKDKDET